MRRLLPLLWLALAAFAPGAPAEPVALTILHTNDIHGYALPAEAHWVKSSPRPLIGGLLALELAVRAERARTAHTLLLDAGDLLTGQPASGLLRGGARGGYLIEAMNLLGYDAGIIGNHEFDEGLPNLRKLIELARFPILCANMTDGRSPPLPTAPYRILTRGPLKIAVIGVVSPSYRRLVSPRLLAPFTIAAPARALQPLIHRLRADADLIVLVTHAGVAEDKALARALKGVDVIIGGHSHTRLTRGLVENGVIITQTGCYLRNLGVLELTVDGHKVVRHTARLRPLWVAGATGRPSAAMTQLVGAIQSGVAALQNERLGELATAWVRSRGGESNVGSFIAESIRRQTRVDIGMINSGGIRCDLPAGPLTRASLMTVLPFRNKIVTFELTGAQLKAVCRHNARAALTGDHGVLQLAGVRYAWRRLGAKSVELTRVSVGGKPVDVATRYRCATNEYVAVGQPGKYLGLVPGPVTVSDVIDIEAVIAEIKRLGGTVEARVMDVMQQDRGK